MAGAADGAVDAKADDQNTALYLAGMEGHGEAWRNSSESRRIGTQWI